MNGQIIDYVRQACRQNHRIFLVLTSNKNVEQNAYKFYSLLLENSSSLPVVLWCYDKKKKVRKIKDKKRKKEIVKDCIHEDDIKRVCYQEIDIVMGNSFDMLVLNDFDQITPNILAKTIETVRGGGIIVIVLEEKEYSIFNHRILKSFYESAHVLVLDEDMKPKLDVDLSSWRTDHIEIDKSKFEHKLCMTSDQDKALSRLCKIMANKNTKHIALLRASRGRGKSVALGLAIAEGIEMNYSTIYVVSPHMDNVKMLFEFAVRGLKHKGYKENVDFEIVKEFKNKSFIKRIQIKKRYTQIIEYHGILDTMNRHPDLLVIDEAAAIPLYILKRIICGNMVLMASTTDGYEGTGRAMALKFLSNLKQKNDAYNSYVFCEIKLEESIRYNRHDPVEKWLNEILVLNTYTYKNKFCPPSEKCQLFLVNKASLFSFHKLSESFLKQIFSIFTSSHYKNTPDDMKTVADECNHHIFVLLASEKDEKLPKIMCAVHVAVEENIFGGEKSGNLIPWTLSAQFLDDFNPASKGLRIVRIAVHPDYQSMGYGTQTIRMLVKFCSDGCGEFPQYNVSDALLLHVDDLERPKIDYIGVSMGLNERIHRFWHSNNFYPVYIKQTVNFSTGEYTSIFLHNMNARFDNFYTIFRERFVNLMCFCWKEFSVQLCMMLISTNNVLPACSEHSTEYMHKLDRKYDTYFEMADLKRLISYVEGYSELNIVMDLIPTVARHYFQTYKKFLSTPQESILLAIGCQLKNINLIALELDITKEQVQFLIKKIISKFLKTNNHTY